MISPADDSLFRCDVALMAGGVGERISCTWMLRCIARTSASQVSFRRVPAHALHTDSEGDDVPSGSGGRAVTRPFQAFTFEIQHHARLSYSCTSSRRATRSMWRCSARRSGHHRLHERPCASRQLVSVGLRQRIFFLLCPFNGRTVSSIRRAFSRWAALAFSSWPARVADIQGWCCQTFSGSSYFRLRKL